jgi:hypothetical protein
MSNRYVKHYTAKEKRDRAYMRRVRRELRKLRSRNPQMTEAQARLWLKAWLDKRNKR